jgi:hypothetical protein
MVQVEEGSATATTPNTDATAITTARPPRSEPSAEAALPPPIPAAEAIASPMTGATNAAGGRCWANIANVTP